MKIHRRRFRPMTYYQQVKHRAALWDDKRRHCTAGVYAAVISIF